MAVRYKQVEEVLSRIFEVDPDDLKAFRARLRHLRNLGIPTDLPQPGSGAQIQYTRNHILELLIALELTALGIAPRHAAHPAVFLRLLEAMGLENNYLYLIVYVFDNVFDNEFDVRIEQLKDADILKRVGENHRISFVHLTPSLEILDQYLKDAAGAET